MANDNPTTAALATVPTDADAISVFASESNFTNAQRMARALMASDLMPAAFRGNMPNVLIAMELASRVKASVLMVAQNLDVIHGRPSWRSQFLIACVNNSGRFSPLRFRFQGDEGKASWGCRAVAKDRETGEECVGTLVTIAMANAEGWATKNGSKWKTLPELMLQYRAAAFWARVYAPELSLGMQTADEVRDVFGAADASEVAQLPSNLTPPGAESLNASLGLAQPAPALIVEEDGTVLAHPPSTAE